MKTKIVLFVFSLALSIFFLRDAKADVIEFYNGTLDHFFYTSDLAEASAIDNSSAGPGWSRTGLGFKAIGPKKVCRFYGSVSPGPNSHFYTADQAECDGLKKQQALTPATSKRWNFESLDFSTTEPDAGACIGSMPIYRAYNNGFAKGKDSNHRLSTSLSVMFGQVSKGWTIEGAVMCAPLQTDLVLTGAQPIEQYLLTLQGNDFLSLHKNANSVTVTYGKYGLGEIFLVEVVSCDILSVNVGVDKTMTEVYIERCGI